MFVRVVNIRIQSLNYAILAMHNVCCALDLQIVSAHHAPADFFCLEQFAMQCVPMDTSATLLLKHAKFVIVNALNVLGLYSQIV